MAEPHTDSEQDKAGRSAPDAREEGLLGAKGDPAEGRRDVPAEERHIDNQDPAAQPPGRGAPAERGR